MRTFRHPWMIYYAITLHAVWGLVLLFSDAPLYCVALSGLAGLDHHVGVGIALLLVALGAAVGLRPKYAEKYSGLLMTLPQQFALMGSAGTALVCIVNQRYADGVERHWTFILSDQLPALLAMVLHSGALIDWFVWSKR